MSGALRGLLALVVAVALGGAIAGVGMGESPAQRQPAPSPAQVTAARQRIAAGSASVRRGRALFTAQGCDSCHSIAAIGANGKLGPRLDMLAEDADHNLESIIDPRDKTTDGYPAKLMPTVYGERLSDTDLQALADFVTTASGGRAGGGDSSGKGGGGGGADSSGKGSGGGSGGGGSGKG